MNFPEYLYWIKQHENLETITETRILITLDSITVCCAVKGISHGY